MQLMPPPYLHRYIDRELDDLLPDAAAVAIDGAKGVGKTATASRRADVVIALDSPETRQLIEADTVRQITRENTVCLDEWQHYPPVWDAVRRQVDAHASTRFILTGSAGLPAGTDTHSGAGRILSLRMRPLSVPERGTVTPTVLLSELFNSNGQASVTGRTEVDLESYADMICSTGFPGIVGLTGRLHRSQVEGYISRVIGRDIADAGILVRKPGALRAWWTAYAAASSTAANYTTILDAATAGDAEKISKDAALSYRELLTQLWILDPVPAWTPALLPFKRLTTTPKHQVVDPGIAAALLGVTPQILTSGSAGSGELFGQLLESLVTLTVRVAGQAAEAKTYHLRTRGGEREVDLILERYDGKIIALEVKLSPVVRDDDVKHLHWLGNQLGDRLAEKIIVTTGHEAFRRADGVAVVPLALLG